MTPEKISASHWQFMPMGTELFASPETRGIIHAGSSCFCWLAYTDLTARATYRCSRSCLEEPEQEDLALSGDQRRGLFARLHL